MNRFKLYLIFSVFFLTALHASSQNVWRTLDSGPWFTARWSLNGVETTAKPYPNCSCMLEIAHDISKAADTEFNSSNTHLVIKNGGSLTVNGKVDFTHGPARLTVESGGTLTTTTDLAFKQSPVTHTIAGTVNVRTLHVNTSATVNITGSVTTTSDFLVDQAANISLGGTYNIGRDFKITAAATFTGSPASMTIENDFTTNNATFNLDTTGGLIHVKNDFITNGSNSVRIGNPMQIDGDVMIAGGAMIFNGRVTVNGKFVKANNNNLTFAKRTTIIGDAIFGGGQAVTINPGVLLTAPNIYIGNAVAVTVNGFMNAQNQLHVGYTPSYTSVYGGTVNASNSGSNSVVGSGVVGWGSLNVTSNNNFIGCTTGTKYGFCSTGCTNPYLSVADGGPNNPLNLTTCGTGVLPVVLARFTAFESAGKVTLDWATASEKNSAYFIIEKSSNGSFFEEIGSVKAAGNSSSVINYSYIDTNPGSGTIYYRLKTVDNEGPFSYSGVISVRSLTAGFSFFPNPTNGTVLHLSFATDIKPSSYSIITLSGETMDSGALTNNLQSITIKNPLKPGIYILQINTELDVFREKLEVSH